MEEKEQGEELLLSIVEERIKVLFKAFLIEVESLNLDHKIILEKVQEKTSKEFVSNVNSLTEEKFQNIRKKILDHGNECSREIISLISCFDNSFNQEKFDKICQKGKTIKKTIYSPLISK